MAVGRSRVEEGQGIVGPMICAAGVLRVEMACGVDPGTYVLEWSDAQENWAMDFGGMVGKGGDNKAGEAEDILGAVSCSRGSRGSIVSAQSGRQWQSPKPPPPPLPALQASLAREGMARMSLSLSPSSSVGVSRPIIISLDYLVLVLP